MDHQFVNSHIYELKTPKVRQQQFITFEANIVKLAKATLIIFFTESDWGFALFESYCQDCKYKQLRQTTFIQASNYGQISPNIPSPKIIILVPMK